MKIISIVNNNGGVGKTISALNLTAGIVTGETAEVRDYSPLCPLVVLYGTV